jgi:hypothetical protein
VLAAEHLLDLAGVDETGELIDAIGQLGANFLTLPRPLDEHSQVVGTAPERVDQLDVFLHAPAALEDLLRVDLVLPEIRG